GPVVFGTRALLSWGRMRKKPGHARGTARRFAGCGSGGCHPGSVLPPVEPVPDEPGGRRGGDSGKAVERSSEKSLKPGSSRSLCRCRALARRKADLKHRTQIYFPHPRFFTLSGNSLKKVMNEL